jgi:aquaporin Z
MGAGFDAAKGFAANGYGAHSPGHYGLLSCFVTEVIMTMMFLFIIMGSTHGNAPVGFNWRGESFLPTWIA